MSSSPINKTYRREEICNPKGKSKRSTRKLTFADWGSFFIVVTAIFTVMFVVCYWIGPVSGN